LKFGKEIAKFLPQTSSAPLLQDSNCSEVFRDMKITAMSERPVKWIAEAVQQTSTTSHSIVHSSSDFYILKDLQDVQAI
jgi:hypothetical protein